MFHGSGVAITREPLRIGSNEQWCRLPDGVPGDHVLTLPPTATNISQFKQFKDRPTPMEHEGASDGKQW